MTIETIKLYPIDQIGQELMPGVVRLNSRFIKRVLQKLHEKVICPFCKTGILSEKKVEKIWGTGIGGRGRPQHIVNKYRYECTNTKCAAQFSGIVQWMWID